MKRIFLSLVLGSIVFIPFFQAKATDNQLQSNLETKAMELQPKLDAKVSSIFRILMPGAFFW